MFKHVIAGVVLSCALAAASGGAAALPSGAVGEAANNAAMVQHAQHGVRRGPARVAPMRVAPRRAAPMHVAPRRVAPMHVAPRRVAPLHVAPRRVAPRHLHVHPIRRWHRRPHYGVIIGGVTLGAILAASAYAASPPAPGLCWYWVDPTRTRGYWDYCY